MEFTMVHNNLNVFDLDKSLKFYADALGLREDRRINADDGSFIIVFLTDSRSAHRLELTWLKDRTEPYDLGDNEIHLCFSCGNYAKALERHREMGCVCFENNDMGIYFIEDPDGYWLEIVPGERSADA